MKVWIEVDTEVPEDAEFLRRKRHGASAINPDFARDVARTMAGQSIVIPWLKAMAVGTPYTAEELGRFINEPVQRISYGLSAVGRVEREYPGHRVFVHHLHGQGHRYSVTPEMRDAILKAESAG
jgi:hypothetical protein